MNVNFTPQAKDDLTAIRDWFAEDDPRAADNVVARIVQMVRKINLRPRNY
ncbi:MAG: type II toxin-antitoxin system RelE/ParE family toxin [Sphingobium sp.]|nr:type II toxin-antitoxin system RelE/ParE family toxin [Sphingobium sp.]MBP6112433.1 type II toxin-antitoxin system RelE/ParE family toxin [Sphingobium sp.]MBP8671128.1 type II toxin-antitoxin system RelE/ParE family toxin [Sphingobium sp.]MBP9157052.1 type II toxin-antitoxin system RelE/ParE family toxin [Sphingobium sp.]MCC6480827.1 type II toxin-antitoxin system RelE/ParE family toxin [Sphingomonadaceae bacterium]